MSIISWKKEQKKTIKREEGENKMKFANDYKDRYQIIKEMGEKCDKWKNIDYSFASSKILQAETDLEIQCAYEKTSFDKPKKWYKNEDAVRIEELLLSNEKSTKEVKTLEEVVEEVKKYQEKAKTGKTRIEISKEMEEKYGFKIWGAEFTRIERELKLKPMSVPENGTRVNRYVDKDLERLYNYLENNLIPRKEKRKVSKGGKVKIMYDDTNVYGYIKKKVAEYKTRIHELEKEIEEKDRIIADLHNKSFENELEKIKKIFD